MFGCAPPNTRRAVLSISSSVVTASRTSLSVGEGDRITLTMRRTYAQTLYKDSSATLDDLREAVETLEDTQRIAQRVLGSANPTTVEIEGRLRNARAALGSREMTASGRGTTRAGDVRALREAVAAMSTTSD